MEAPDLVPHYYDSHMHTTLCKHAWGLPEEYAEFALQRGLAGIIFTCHSPMPRGFWPHVRMDDSQFDEYVALVHRCRDHYAGRLDVRLGMESDYFPGFEDWVRELHGRADFHYILGSVHWQGPEYHRMFGQGSPADFRRSYWENLAASAETGLFDCLAHPDLIKNFRASEWVPGEWEENVTASLDRIAKTGVAMELNTSGVHKSYSQMNPSLSMLSMMKARGIPVVVGSDSHKPMRVGENFIFALEKLQRAGYETVRVFENRKPTDLAIAGLLPGLKAAAQRNADELNMFATV
ncbi:MAG TPA: histidinol-phosphatase [Candidatus Saccharimonadia bacterium]|nr:histidinol-phosphatase [Candidatus Saccharimonadia bacterium]